MVDQRKPREESSEARIVHAQPIRTTDPVVDARISLPSIVDQLRHGIDTFDVDATLVEVVRPLTRPAADVDDPPVDRSLPREHLLTILLGRCLDAAEPADVLRRTTAVCITNPRNGHRATRDRSTPPEAAPWKRFPAPDPRCTVTRNGHANGTTGAEKVGAHSSALARTFSVETMGLEPTTSCLQTLQG